MIIWDELYYLSNYFLKFILTINLKYEIGYGRNEIIKIQVQAS